MEDGFAVRVHGAERHGHADADTTAGRGTACRFMDRHEVRRRTAADIAQAHVRDLAMEAKSQVKFLTYGFDLDRGTGALPGQGARERDIIEVHREAHGHIPDDIVNVSEDNVLPIPRHDQRPGRPHPERELVRVVLFTDLEGSTSLLHERGSRRSCVATLRARPDHPAARVALPGRGRDAHRRRDCRYWRNRRPRRSDAARERSSVEFGAGGARDRGVRGRSRYVSAAPRAADAVRIGHGRRRAQRIGSAFTTPTTRRLRLRRRTWARHQADRATPCFWADGEGQPNSSARPGRSDVVRDQGVEKGSSSSTWTCAALVAGRARAEAAGVRQELVRGSCVGHGPRLRC